eukprot:6192561-Pleurochrysis_carterae.AAC.3
MSEQSTLIASLSQGIMHEMLQQMRQLRLDAAAAISLRRGAVATATSAPAPVPAFSAEAPPTVQDLAGIAGLSTAISRTTLGEGAGPGRLTPVAEFSVAEVGVQGQTAPEPR